MDAKDLLAPVVATVAILALWVVARGMRRITTQPRRVVSQPPAWAPAPTATFDTLVRAVRAELERKIVAPFNWDRSVEQLRTDFRRVVEHLVDIANPLLNRVERERLIDEVVAGIKPLQVETTCLTPTAGRVA